MDLGHTKATNPTQPLATARTLASPSEDVSALMSELFPTLDRPMTATSVRPVGRVYVLPELFWLPLLLVLAAVKTISGSRTMLSRIQKKDARQFDMDQMSLV